MTTGSVAKVSVVRHTSTTIINQQAELLKKPARSRVDYNFFNYCSQCDLKLSKQTFRCPECKQKVRTKPWHRSKVIQFKRV
jgi:lipopolysaccharide biosynthesis regulator YciM